MVFHSYEQDIYLYSIELYCFDGVVIAAQCTAAFLRSFMLPQIWVLGREICRCNFAQRSIFSGLRFFNEPEISDSGPPV